LPIRVSICSICFFELLSERRTIRERLAELTSSRRNRNEPDTFFTPDPGSDSEGEVDGPDEEVM